MSILIACCGLNCETCEARIATVNNDDELRRKTAAKWREMFNAPQITSESINCVGCRTSGVKFAHCEMCEIRNCVIEKGFETCANCSEMKTCEKVKFIHDAIPEAVENLNKLR